MSVSIVFSLHRFHDRTIKKVFLPHNLAKDKFLFLEIRTFVKLNVTLRENKLTNYLPVMLKNNFFLLALAAQLTEICGCAGYF